LLLVPLGEILRGKLGGTLPGLHYFIYGIVVIAVILLTPRGLLPLFKSQWTRWRGATRIERWTFVRPIYAPNAVPTEMSPLDHSLHGFSQPMLSARASDQTERNLYWEENNRSSW